MKQFIVHARFDPEAKVWWGSNDQLPLSTEAPTLDLLLTRATEIAPEIAVLNGLAKLGEEVKIEITAERISVYTG